MTAPEVEDFVEGADKAEWGYSDSEKHNRFGNVLPLFPSSSVPVVQIYDLVDRSPCVFF
ncbi:unnamed protein product [Linum tenue]|uniref:Uncharacterized protein n=1 Tax=Linum tenue TaxID=586396 RepID=A0AAV0I1L8_9ROSI|nr:unnamed protein product [Linum tenue]